MFFNANDGPDEIKKKLKQVAEGINSEAESLLKQYNFLRNNEPWDDSPETLICKRIFDEAEKEGTHRKLLFSFYKAATELTNMVRDSDLDTPTEILRLLDRVLDATEKFNKLRESASLQLAKLKKEISKLKLGT